MRLLDDGPGGIRTPDWKLRRHHGAHAADWQQDVPAVSTLCKVNRRPGWSGITHLAVMRDRITGPSTRGEGREIVRRVVRLVVVVGLGFTAIQAAAAAPAGPRHFSFTGREQ